MSKSPEQKNRIKRKGSVSSLFLLKSSLQLVDPPMLVPRSPMQKPVKVQDKYYLKSLHEERSQESLSKARRTVPSASLFASHRPDSEITANVGSYQNRGHECCYPDHSKYQLRHANHLIGRVACFLHALAWMYFRALESTGAFCKTPASLPVRNCK